MPNPNSIAGPIPLDALGLNRRAYHSLHRVGVEFLDQLLAYSDEDLLQLGGIGPTTVEQIRRKLREFELAAVRPDSPELPKPVERMVSPSGHVSILHCGLSKRTAQALGRADIHTINDLLQRSHEEIAAIRNIGELAQEEIDEFLTTVDVDTVQVSDTGQTGSVLSLLKEYKLDELPIDLSWRRLLLLGLSWQEIEDLEEEFARRGLPPLEKFPKDSIVGPEVFEYLARIGCPLQKIAAGRASAKEENRVHLRSARIRTLLDVCLLGNSQLDNLLGVASVEYRQDLDWYLQQLPSLDWAREANGVLPNPVVVWRLQQVAVDKVWVDALVALGISGRDLEIFLARSLSFGARKPTLEKLGKRYGVTRERVRQIEGRCKRQASYALRDNEVIATIALLARRIIIEQGIISRRELANIMADMYGLQEEGCEPELSQILFLDKVEYCRILDAFVSAEIPEDLPIKLHGHLYEQLHAAKAPILERALSKSLDAHLCEKEANLNDRFDLWEKALEESKDFERVEELYWGLTKWESRVLDEIVMALREAGKPTHFNEITNLANKRLGKDQQTTAHATHSKLGNHKDLFIRTGPGTFGLREWDPDKPSQPIKYLTLLNQVLEEAGDPMSFDEIFQEVNALRTVKWSTVTMYLDMNDNFMKFDDGRYGLSTWHATQKKADSDKLPEEFRLQLKERAMRAFASREDERD